MSDQSPAPLSAETIGAGEDVGHAPSIPILVVDDEPLVGDVIKRFAEKRGFHVDIVTDPQNFGVVYNVKTRIIFLDLHMPGIDGIEIMRFLSENKSQSYIILASGSDASVLRAAEGLASSYGLSVLDTLRKPFGLAEIEQSLNRFLEIDNKENQELSAKRSMGQFGSPELPSADDLRQAITEKTLEIHFQPKIHLGDHGFAGAEALIRWFHPTKGTIPPDFFIPFAEKFNLIDDITALVMEKVCDYLKRRPTGSAPFQVSVNISERNLDDLDLPEKLSRVVTEGGLTPASFILEMTESTLAANPNHVLDVLTRLRLKGFGLSIDDFGTGHSSLARLRNLPFGELKIDKMFVEASDTDPECLAILKNTIDLARDLSLDVVAEGAERQVHLDLLTEYGCNKVQGYVISKPMAPAEFDAWLDDWQANHSTENTGNTES